MSRIAFICQRVPFLSHVFVFFVAWYGPLYTPLFYTTIYAAIHIMMHVANWQTLWGAYSAYVGIREQVKGEWRKAWADKAAHDIDLERDGHNDILPVDVEHVIIVPNYKEELEVLRETLDCLASHPAARYQYRICLAMEAREEGATDKAARLTAIYSDRFKAVVHTMHPGNIPGEAVGKASNVNWAARQVAASSPAALRARQILTIIDSDIFLAADFFQRAALRFTHLTRDERTRVMFLMPIVFDRNPDKVPRGVRATDVMWALAGMSTLYPTSMIKIPTSAYAISMELAVRIGFWDVGPEGIGEDFHMLCKSLLSTGTLITETIYSPASVTDVVGSQHGNGVRGWVSDILARYQQAVRHLWGSLDTGYVLRSLITQPRRGDDDVIDDCGSDSELSADTAVEMAPLDKRAFIEEEERAPRVPILHALALLCKCYQAHLMLVHFTIMLTLPQLHWNSPPSVALCVNPNVAQRSEPGEYDVAEPLLAGTVVTLFAMFRVIFFQLRCRSHLIAYYVLEICAYIRSFSVVSTIGALLCYHFYRKTAIERYFRPGAERTLGSRPGSIYNPTILSFIDYAGMPISLAFSVAPAVYSQIMHLLTNRLTYTVSFKPRVNNRTEEEIPLATAAS